MSADPPTAEKVEKLLVDARARLVWGEPPDDVRNMLLDNGLDTQFVDNVMHSIQTSRGRSMRKKGFRDTAIGAAVVVGTTIWAVTFVAIGFNMGRYYRPFFGVAGISSFVFCYGWYLIFRGAERLIFGAHAEGADSDLED